jgi:hypothetical protein
VPRWAVGDVLEASTPDHKYQATLEVISVVPERDGDGWMWVIASEVAS